MISTDPAKQRFSLGLDLTECTLDCSIELCDSSATSAQDSSPLLNKPTNSFEGDESLGILTPDQMNEFLDSNATNLNLDFPLKLSLLKCRVDQTPSPEELPLDLVEVRTCDTKKNINEQREASDTLIPIDMSQSESYSKATDSMSKSAGSKVSNSFITSVTSIASLDNGYQGDGEMSRPASRGGCKELGESSPMSVRRIGNERRKKLDNNDNIPIMRRQDPMTDSDFFTESDAEDALHRGDRRAHIIDGHLYNGNRTVAIDEQQPNDAPSSCMDSSGIYTDNENRGEMDNDMSPDGSTDTVKSSDRDKQLSIEKNDSFSLQNETCFYQKLTVSRSAQSLASCSTESSLSGDVRKSITVAECDKGGDQIRQQQTKHTSHCVNVIKEASSITVGASSHTTSTATSSVRSSSSSTSVSTCTEKSVALVTIKGKKYHYNRRYNKNEPNTFSSKQEVSTQRETKTMNAAKKNGANESASSDTVKNLPKRALKVTPNKWDNVMNKIAINKAMAEVNPKNYNQVKSKVTCGIKRSSPTSRYSPMNGMSPADQFQVSASLIATETATTTNGNIEFPIKKENALPVSRKSTHVVVVKRFAIQFFLSFVKFKAFTFDFVLK